MSSPPGLPGAASWRHEAEAVIADIAPHVSVAALSSLSGDSSGALLNVTTLEGRQLTVLLTSAGFSVCGEGHDSCPPSSGSGAEGGRVYETPYALLHELSPAYTAAFGQSLADRLGQLADGGMEEDEGEAGQVEGEEGCEEMDRPGADGKECRSEEPRAVHTPEQDAT